MEMIINFIICLIVLIFLLCEIFLPIVLFLSYLGDCILLIIKLIIKLLRLQNVIKKIIEFMKKYIKIPKWLQNMKVSLMRILDVNYEIPFITYCFPVIVIEIVSEAVLLPCFANQFQDTEWLEWLCLGIASIVYVIIYFLGMTGKYVKDEKKFENILENNENFLKLSFLPFVFLITVIGFCFTITGKNIFDEEIIDYLGMPTQILIESFQHFKNLSSERVGLQVLVQFLTLNVMMYTMSLPVQLFARWGVELLTYFYKYKNGYLKTLKIVFEEIKMIF